MIKIWSHRTRSKRKTQRGAALVEFAIFGSLMMFMTFSAIQFSVIMNAYNTLSQISREGARYAAIHGTESTFDSSSSTSGSLQNFVHNLCAGTTIPYSQLTVTPGYFDSSGTFHANTISDTTNRAAGMPITVQVSYNMANKLYISPSWTRTSAFNKTVIKYGTMIIEGHTST